MADPTPKGFFVFGLQRTGTNYLATLMRRNFNLGDRASWKHSVPVHSEEALERKITDRIILILYKDPYRWIESLCQRRCVDWVKTQTQFHAHEGGYRIGNNKLNPINLAKTYVQHYTNWVENAPEHISTRSTVIKYEYILADKERPMVLDYIAGRYKLTKPSSYSNPTSVSMTGKLSDQSKEYYLSEALSLLNCKDVERINEVLTKDFMKKIGYKQIQPEDVKFTPYK